MTEMNHDLLDWVKSEGDNLGFKDITSAVKLREQASLRQYFRIFTDAGTYIGVVGNPNSDENQLFHTNAKYLRSNDVQVPDVMALNHEKGFLIVQDFGDLLLQDLIGKNEDDFLYKEALSSLIKIQSCKPEPNLSHINIENLIAQMHLFEEWFLNALLRIDFRNQYNLISKGIKHIADECSKQTRKVCHFDYEFRNLMLLSNEAIGVLDFQDLCVGPYGIDLVAIIKDIDNPLSKKKSIEYSEFFLAESHKVKNLREINIETLLRDIDYAGFQRQFRILGTLSRLHLRDKKSFRLQDLPQTLEYLISGMDRYDPLKEFSKFLETVVQPCLFEILEDLE